MRKHHCRHCGRLLCGKCSAKEKKHFNGGPFFIPENLFIIKKQCAVPAFLKLFLKGQLYLSLTFYFVLVICKCNCTEENCHFLEKIFNQFSSKISKKRTSNNPLLIYTFFLFCLGKPQLRLFSYLEQPKLFGKVLSLKSCSTGHI